MELKELIKRTRDDEVILEESPVEVSRSNGYVGRAMQTVQDQIRTMRSSLEGRLGEDVKSDHTGLSWLVIHSANLINTNQKGVDGCTAYRRANGKGIQGHSN